MTGKIHSLSWKVTTHNDVSIRFVLCYWSVRTMVKLINGTITYVIVCPCVSISTGTSVPAAIGITACSTIIAMNAIATVRKECCSLLNKSLWTDYEEAKRDSLGELEFRLMMMMRMIGIVRPLLCTWDEPPLNVMKRSQRWNTLKICPRGDSNSGSSDLWSNTLPLDHGGTPNLY